MDARKLVMCEHLPVANGDGLEFGPLNCPMVRKTEGSIRYVDVRSTDDLRATIPALGEYRPADFVEIDYVWPGGRFRDAVGSDALFDYAIASHVIEHTPNMVGWLNQVASVLKDNGLISLAVPDCRYSADILRGPTSTATIVADFLRADSQPRAQHVFYHFSLAVVVPTGDDYWRFLSGEIDPLTLPRHHTPQQALEMARRAEMTGTYVDCHAYTFTPDSFTNIIRETSNLGLHSLSVVRSHFPEGPNHEFFVTLGGHQITRY